jgi:hypothetical protein
MKGKFEISGRTAAQPAPSPMDDAMDRFIEGAEPMTTVTVQIPERLKHALKQAALDRKTTVKALVIKAIDDLLAASTQ